MIVQPIAVSIVVVLDKKKHAIFMSKWFRSEPMEYISLIVNEDAAHDCLADLGKMGVIQFTDVSFVVSKPIDFSSNYFL